jgi:hypothetical protein
MEDRFITSLSQGKKVFPTYQTKEIEKERDILGGGALNMKTYKYE